VTKVRAVHESGFERVEGDFYPTPAWVTECLLSKVRLRGPVWEPCCGDGAIAKVLTAAGHEVVATDLADRGFGAAGIDFFATSHLPESCRTLVTNPPYGDGGSRGRTGKAAANMLGFAEHAIRLARQAEGQLALLVRFQWIAGKRVASLLTEAKMHSAIVLTRRIRWFDNDGDHKAGQHHHAWIFFDFAAPPVGGPALVFADGPDGQRDRRAPLDQSVLPLFGRPSTDADG
jgi:hypothetical protein